MEVDAVGKPFRNGRRRARVAEAGHPPRPFARGLRRLGIRGLFDTGRLRAGSAGAEMASTTV